MTNYAVQCFVIFVFLSYTFCQDPCAGLTGCDLKMCQCNSGCASTYVGENICISTSSGYSTSCICTSSLPSISWSGTYTINSSSCALNSGCCCLVNQAIVGQNGTNILIQTPANGSVCNFYQGKIVNTTFTLQNTNSYSALFDFRGDTYQAKLVGTNLQLKNLITPQCSMNATCVSGNCANNNSPKSSNTLPLYIIIIIVCAIAGVLIMVCGVCYVFQRSRRQKHNQFGYYELKH